MQQPRSGWGRRLAILLVPLLALPALGEEEAPAPAPPVVIALVAPLTGPAADFGESCRSGAKLAMERLALGRDRPPLKLIVMDDAADVDQAVKIARQLGARGDVAFVVGHFTAPEMRRRAS